MLIFRVIFQGVESKSSFSLLNIETYFFNNESICSKCLASYSFSYGNFSTPLFIIFPHFLLCYTGFIIGLLNSNYFPKISYDFYFSFCISSYESLLSLLLEYPDRLDSLFDKHYFSLFYVMLLSTFFLIFFAFSMKFNFASFLSFNLSLKKWPCLKVLSLEFISDIMREVWVDDCLRNPTVVFLITYSSWVLTAELYIC